MNASQDFFRPMFEPLESRLLLNGVVIANVIEGDLVIEGDAMDNAIVLTALSDGSYEIIGVDTADGPTLVNGMPSTTTLQPVTGIIDIDMGSGDNVFSIGSLAGLNTTINLPLRLDMGGGTNHFNIGRIQTLTGMSFGGEVTINASTEVTNTVFGVGNVFIAGAKMQSFEADLGMGTGEREVVIADIWHGLTYYPPSDIVDIMTDMGDLTISNSHGQLAMTVLNTSAGNVDITTATAGDIFTFAGVDFSGMVLRSGHGSDEVTFERTEYRGNVMEELILDAGMGDDRVTMSDTHITSYAYLDMERASCWSAQALSIAAYGHCEFGDLAIRGEGLLATFNGIRGTHETMINGYLNIETAVGMAEDYVGMLNVIVAGETSIDLFGGNDTVSILDSKFDENVIVELSHGNDEFHVGEMRGVPVIPTFTEFDKHLIVNMGDGTDRAAVTNAEVVGLLALNLGKSSGGTQRAQIATRGGTVHAGTMGITGEGQVSVAVGNSRTPGWSLTVDGNLTVSTGMAMDRDSVLLKDIFVGGTLAISTGDGFDRVSIQRSEINNAMAHLGDGMDILSIWDCDFTGDAEFFGDEGPDIMSVRDSHFTGLAKFDGGDGSDMINRNLRSRNVFDMMAQPWVHSIERGF
jgi:hypothetical protein